MENNDKLLEELLELALKKEIPYTPAQLKKMNQDKLVEVMSQYRLKEMDKMNEDLVDVTFTKFEHIMKRIELIKEDSTLAEKLKDRKLLRKDLKHVIASLTFLLPYVGLLEGVIVCAGEVYEKMSHDSYDSHNDNKNDNSSSKTSEGEKHSENEQPTSSDKE